MRVLVVDDEPATANSLRRLLEEDGHKVRCAYTVLDTLAAVAESVASDAIFHVAILDWQLGNTMTGIELKKKLSAGTIPVLMSGHTLQDIRATWVDPLSGFPFFLEKPFSKESVREILGHAEDMQEVTKR